MHIREAVPGDVSELKVLWTEFIDYHSDLDSDYTRSGDALANWADYIDTKFDDDLAKILVAVEDEIVVGYIGAMIRMYPPVWTISKYGYIEEIAVTENFRRKGIASQLLTAAQKWLLSQGTSRIKVNIDSANEASQGFFRSQGFLDNTETLIKKF